MKQTNFIKAGILLTAVVMLIIGCQQTEAPKQPVVDVPQTDEKVMPDKMDEKVKNRFINKKILVQLIKFLVLIIGALSAIGVYLRFNFLKYPIIFPVITFIVVLLIYRYLTKCNWKESFFWTSWSIALAIILLGLLLLWSFIQVVNMFDKLPH